MRIGTLRAMSSIVTTRLSYQAPLAWMAFSQFLAGRSAESVERVAGNCYWRTVRLGSQAGWICVEPVGDREWLRLRASANLKGQLPALIARLKHTFDLSARPQLIDAHLRKDAALRALVRRT